MAKYFLLLTLIVAVIVARNFYNLRIRIYTRIIFLALIFIASLVIIFPDVAQVIANFVGIGRGADLVFYLFAMSQIGLIGILIGKFREIDMRLTQIIRELSLLEHDFSRKKKKDV